MCIKLATQMFYCSRTVLECSSFRVKVLNGVLLLSIQVSFLFYLPIGTPVSPLRCSQRSWVYSGVFGFGGFRSVLRLPGCLLHVPLVDCFFFIDPRPLVSLPLTFLGFG